VPEGVLAIAVDWVTGVLWLPVGVGWATVLWVAVGVGRTTEVLWVPVGVGWVTGVLWGWRSRHKVDNQCSSY
jgi:hypothetical protein